MADIDESIRGLRIITSSIMASLLGMAAVAFFTRAQLAPSFTGEVRSALLGLACLLAASSVVAYFVLQRSIRAGLRADGAVLGGGAEPLQGVIEPFRRLVIVRAALVEGPGLVGLLSYLVGGSEAGLLIAAASFVLLAGTMPSREALQRFADGLPE